MLKTAKELTIASLLLLLGYRVDLTLVPLLIHELDEALQAILRLNSLQETPRKGPKCHRMVCIITILIPCTLGTVPRRGIVKLQGKIDPFCDICLALVRLVDD